MSRRRGLTLVEVLAGAALLGTLLVAILVARGRLTAQNRLADERIEACAVLDELVADWWDKRADEPIPRNAGGVVPGRNAWQWRTRIVADREANGLGGEIVRVELFADSRTALTPAAAVDLLLPTENEKDAKEERPDID